MLAPFKIGRSKSENDGFMVAFSGARLALESAIVVSADAWPPQRLEPGQPVKVRIGLHPGEAIKEGEDFFEFMAQSIRGS